MASRILALRGGCLGRNDSARNQLVDCRTGQISSIQRSTALGVECTGSNCRWLVESMARRLS